MSFLVLTGDIVESSALEAEALDAAMAALHSAAEAVAAHYAPCVMGFARRGGDGWQMVIDRPKNALRIALYLRACLRRASANVTTRIAIAEGAARFPEGQPPDPNSGHGAALTASGRLLSNLPTHALMAHAGGGALAAATLLADEIAKGWTQAQARALAEVLLPRPRPRSAVAKELKISRQAVDQALHAGGFPAIEAALTALETQAAPPANGESKP
ncbi:MAG: MarR family transcriptional regulator [Paracoccaceae bacterium]|nr:MarR family transcriptional regulator [Paracoccaceae bacterium]